MNGTGGNIGEAPPAYGAPPSYAQDYAQPPSYAQPPPATNPNYAAPPATNPNYAAPPATNPNYAAPPPAQSGYVPPNYNAPPPSNLNQPSYAQPPSNLNQPSYAQPPSNLNQPSYAQPPSNFNQPSYAQPPPSGTGYDQPPPSQPSYAQPPNQQQAQFQAHEQTTNATRGDFTYSLCSCFDNFKYCCYVCWCTSCAIADLRASLDGSSGTWWGSAVALAVLYIASCTPYTFWIFGAIWNIVACVFLLQVASQMRQRLNIRQGDQCMDCLMSWCCVACRTCQLGRELELTQIPEVRELVLNLQNASPCNQACMNDTNIV